MIEASNFEYRFKAINDGRVYEFGTAQTKYLSSEINGGFTGVLIGLYALNGKAKFLEFSCRNEEEY